MSTSGETLNSISFALQELQTDSSIPKNVKSKIESIISILNSGCEIPIMLNKALNDFDEIVSDINLQPHTRTQIWNIVSILESYSKKD